MKRFSGKLELKLEIGKRNWKGDRNWKAERGTGKRSSEFFELELELGSGTGKLGLKLELERETGKGDWKTGTEIGKRKGELEN